MELDLEQLAAAVLRMPDAARAELGARRLDSLEPDTPEESAAAIASACDTELDRRQAELEANPTVGIPAAEVVRLLDAVLAAHALDLSAADDPLRVRKQHHPAQQRGRINRRAGRVTLKSCVEVRRIDCVIQQMIERLLERLRQQLLGQVDRQQPRLRINVLVARHANTSTRRTSGCSCPQANTQASAISVSTSTMYRLFLQPRENADASRLCASSPTGSVRGVPT